MYCAISPSKIAANAIMATPISKKTVACLGQTEICLLRFFRKTRCQTVCAVNRMRPAIDCIGLGSSGRFDWCSVSVLTSHSRGNGEPGRIRTFDLMLRRHLLYPTELRVHNSDLARSDAMNKSLKAVFSTISASKALYDQI